MSPVPRRERAWEYLVKGSHVLLRQAGLAPEQVTGRRLGKEARPPRPGRPRVVILTPRDWAVHVQWEAMIGQALRLRGADVSFITCGGDLEICDRVNSWEGPPVPCRSCRSYVHDSLDAHGFSWRTIRSGWADDDPNPWPELDEVHARELFGMADMGLSLGQLVEIPVKWFLLAADSAADPLAPITTRRFLRSARRVVRGLAAALDRAQPDVVLLLNGLFFFEALAWELCRRRGIDVVTYERGFIKETLLFRRDAPAGLGDVSEVWERWSDVPLTPEEDARLDRYLDDRRHGRRTIDRYWTRPRFQVPDGRRAGRLATLFTNLTWDSAVIGQDAAFAGMRAWLEAVVAAFGARPEHELVIRAHPAEAKLPGKQTREPVGAFLHHRFEVLPANVRFIGADDDTSSYSLMAATDVGLVYTSTTGLELAMQGKPVVVAGQTHYRGKGFTLDASSPEQFEKLLDAGLSGSAPPVDVERARRYAYLFFFRAPVSSPGVEEHVPGLARITVENLADLEPGSNDDLDRVCDLILGRRDWWQGGGHDDGEVSTPEDPHE